ncbi:unnamed protein product [Arctia plantaginis]|uniref:Uncharacterized protein n=1 Tax=Arctia plantaginis TaxID=874455 RepID=A0A8S0ZLR4_ARCPL|nr:unnamed protein product [Arctia plantaginis]
MLLNRLTSVLEPCLIPEQAGVRRGKSCTSQSVNLVQYIEDGFETQRVTGICDLTVTFDTVNEKDIKETLNSTSNHMTSQKDLAFYTFI